MAKILFVDDETDFLDFMKTYFGELGHDILTTSYGRSGLEMILGEKPDVAVIDVRLKDDFDGMQVIRHTHAQAPAQKMILLTGYKDPGMDAEAIRHGVALCLHKPMAGLPQLEAAILSTIRKEK